MSRTVEIKRSGATAKDDPNCFNRLHWALPPVAKASPGDYIVYETRDALDDQFGSAATAADVAGADFSRVHPMTGPVFIEGAKRGDALAVTVVDIAPNDYGYTAIAPGFGFLRDVITGPFIVNWKLDRLAAVSDQLPNIRIPMCAFSGINRRIAWQARGRRGARSRGCARRGRWLRADAGAQRGCPGNFVRRGGALGCRRA